MTTAATSPATATPADGPYQELIGRIKQANLLAATESLLGWDQETMMPGGGLEFRSRQLAQLASMHHRLLTDPRVGDLLSACEAARFVAAVILIQRLLAQTDSPLHRQ